MQSRKLFGMRWDPKLDSAIAVTIIEITRLGSVWATKYQI